MFIRKVATTSTVVIILLVFISINIFLKISDISMSTFHADDMDSGSPTIHPPHNRPIAVLFGDSITQKGYDAELSGYCCHFLFEHMISFA